MKVKENYIFLLILCTFLSLSASAFGFDRKKCTDIFLGNKKHYEKILNLSEKILDSKITLLSEGNDIPDINLNLVDSLVTEAANLEFILTIRNAGTYNKNIATQIDAAIDKKIISHYQKIPITNASLDLNVKKIENTHMKSFVLEIKTEIDKIDRTKEFCLK